MANVSDDMEDKLALIAKMRLDKHVRFGGRLDDVDGVVSEELEFTAVYSDNPDHPNHQWSKYTPSGSLSLHITNPEAFGKLDVGAEYFVEIRKARS